MLPKTPLWTLFLEISSSKNIDLSRLQPFPLAPVSIALWMIRYHHMQILSLKTFCRRISQRFRLTESELYICFHISPNTLVGERSIIPLQSLGWSNVLLLSRFLTLCYLAFKRKMERNEGQVVLEVKRLSLQVREVCVGKVING